MEIAPFIIERVPLTHDIGKLIVEMNFQNTGEHIDEFLTVVGVRHLVAGTGFDFAKNRIHHVLPHGTERIHLNTRASVDVQLIPLAAENQMPLLHGGFQKIECALPVKMGKIVQHGRRHVCAVFQLTQVSDGNTDCFAYIDVGSGPSLLFVTMPSLLAQLPAGGFFCFLFFVLLLFASLTSSVSILEIFVPYVTEFFPKAFNRTKASILGSVICLILGIPVSLSFGIWGDVRILGQDIFSLYDNFICIFAYPLIALCTAIIVGWVWGRKNAMNAVTNEGRLGHKKIYDVWFFLVKFVCPVLLLVVLITGLQGFIGSF